MSDCKHTPEVEQRIRRLEDDARHQRREFDLLKNGVESMATQWMADARKWAEAEAKQQHILEAIDRLQTAVENFAALTVTSNPNAGR